MTFPSMRLCLDSLLTPRKVFEVGPHPSPLFFPRRRLVLLCDMLLVSSLPLLALVFGFPPLTFLLHLVFLCFSPSRVSRLSIGTIVVLLGPTAIGYTLLCSGSARSSVCRIPFLYSSSTFSIPYMDTFLEESSAAVMGFYGVLLPIAFLFSPEALDIRINIQGT